MAKMVEDGWAGGEMNVGSDGSKYSPELIKTDWKRTLVVMPKRSTDSGTTIGPFEMAYTRQCEVYQNSRSLLSTEWLTKGEYVMMLLKKEKR